VKVPFGHFALALRQLPDGTDSVRVAFKAGTRFNKLSYDVVDSAQTRNTKTKAAKAASPPVVKAAKAAKSAKTTTPASPLVVKAAAAKANKAANEAEAAKEAEAANKATEAAKTNAMAKTATKIAVVYKPIVFAAILALGPGAAGLHAIKEWIQYNHPEANNLITIKTTLQNGIKASTLIKVKNSYNVNLAAKVNKPSAKGAKAAPQ